MFSRRHQKHSNHNDTSSESEWIDESDDELSDTETELETESEFDSEIDSNSDTNSESKSELTEASDRKTNTKRSYTQTKRKTKKHRKAESTTDISDESESEKDATLNSDEFNKLLFELFPSKFMKSKLQPESEKSKEDKNKNKKVNEKKKSSTISSNKSKDIVNKRKRTRASDKKEQQRNRMSNKQTEKTQTKGKKQTKSSKRKSEELSDTESITSVSSSSSSSSTSTTSSSENNQPEENATDIGFFFAPIGGDLYDDEDAKIQRVLDTKHEEFDSDDEKTFMKEAYTNVPDPEYTVTEKEKRLKKQREEKRALLEAKTNKILKDIDGEYRDLIELKKHLADKLKKKPNSKILVSSYQNCKNAIKKLMKKTRTKNTKQYYKLLKNQVKSEGEIDYFKKKLSNKEQLQILKGMQDVNKHLNIETPHRLSLMQSNIPLQYKATVMNKLNTMFSMDSGDSEYFKMKTWIDTFMRIPFGVTRNLPVTINDGKESCQNYMKKAKQTLDDCVYGMESAKLQVMQLVGNWISNPSAIGTSIAICGPPGTGKTQLVRDGISKILGRDFAFIPLGGAGDASYLEGHGYTYEGSQWGRVVQILLDSKSMNPVIFFDEVDKVAPEGRGREIINILIHLTDTTQNSEFHDKYFSEIDFDLSKALFIFSLNDETLLDPILRDRMYRINTRGYEAKDKLIIARKYIIPKILEQVKFSESEIIFPDDVLHYLVSEQRFTQGESGVRNLKRCLEIIYSKLNLFRLLNENVTDILGKNINLDVEFPYTVSRKAVDCLICNDDQKNPSFLSMYL